MARSETVALRRGTNLFKAAFEKYTLEAGLKADAWLPSIIYELEATMDS